MQLSLWLLALGPRFAVGLPDSAYSCLDREPPERGRREIERDKFGLGILHSSSAVEDSESDFQDVRVNWSRQQQTLTN